MTARLHADGLTRGRWAAHPAPVLRRHGPATAETVWLAGLGIDLGGYSPEQREEVLSFLLKLMPQVPSSVLGLGRRESLAHLVRASTTELRTRQRAEIVRAFGPDPLTTTRRGRVIGMVIDRMAIDRFWFYRMGIIAMAFVLGLSSVLATAVSPAFAAFGLGVVFTTWGVTVLGDFAIRGQSLQEPQFGALLLVAGVGTLVVVAVGVLT